MAEERPATAAVAEDRMVEAAADRMAEAAMVVVVAAAATEEEAVVPTVVVEAVPTAEPEAVPALVSARHWGKSTLATQISRSSKRTFTLSIPTYRSGQRTKRMPGERPSRSWFRVVMFPSQSLPLTKPPCPSMF